jgi:prepilin-type N-terminal cleavage/methylation domain-containing protein/prepilin-type processing-associated H-X9-DG protein
MSHRPLRSAFTLVELMVVIAIIAVMIGLAIPAIHKVREAANRTVCKNNMRQVGLGLLNFEATEGRLPLGVKIDDIHSGGPGITWVVSLLPYLEKEDVYRKIDFRAPVAAGDIWTHTANSMAADAVTANIIPTLRCPSDGVGGPISQFAAGTWSRSNYLAFFGDDSIGGDGNHAAFGVNYGARMSDIADGTTNTMLVGEYLTGVPQSQSTEDPRGVFWLDRAGSSNIYTRFTPNTPISDIFREGECYSAAKLNLPCGSAKQEALNSASSRSRHAGGVNVIMADGSVRFVGNDVSQAAWSAMVTTAGGEPPDAPPAPAKKKKRAVYIRNQYIVVTGGNGDTGDVMNSVKAAGGKVIHHYQHGIKGLAVRIPASKIDAIRKHPRVKYVSQDRLVFKEGQTIPTGVRRIGDRQSTYQAGRGHGPRVNATVGIMDTGIDNTHPDLNVVGMVPIATLTAFDVDGHGTSVAGVAAAIDNGFGVVGVAPGARLIAVKVLNDSGAGADSDILAGMDYVAAHPSSFDVVNMSFGGLPTDQPLIDGVQMIVAAGVSVTCSAGNDGVDAVDHSPSNAPGAIAVAAMCDTDGRRGGLGPVGSFGDPDDTFTSFSNFGSTIWVIAPGEDILSTTTVALGSYGTESGTSLAAPHAAGVVALIIGGESPLAAVPPTILTQNKKGIRNVDIQPIVVNPGHPGRAGGRHKLSPAAIKAILRGTSRESIPGILGDPLSYPLINASSF